MFFFSKPEMVKETLKEIFDHCACVLADGLVLTGATISAVTKMIKF